MRRRITRYGPAIFEALQMTSAELFIHRKKMVLAEVSRRHAKKVGIMNAMMFGSILAINIAAIDLLAMEPEHLTQHAMLLWALIAGSVGMCGRLALLKDEWHPSIIAKTAVTSLSTAFCIAPVVAWFVCKSLGMPETNLILLVAVAWFVAMASPYLIDKYGQPCLDAIGNLGIKRLKKNLGEDESEGSK